MNWKPSHTFRLALFNSFFPPPFGVRLYVVCPNEYICLVLVTAGATSTEGQNTSSPELNDGNIVTHFLPYYSSLNNEWLAIICPWQWHPQKGTHTKKLTRSSSYNSINRSGTCPCIKFAASTDSTEKNTLFFCPRERIFRVLHHWTCQASNVIILVLLFYQA